MTFPVGRDTLGSYRRFQPTAAISPFPVDVIVRADGTIAYLKGEYDPAAMRAVLDSLLKP